jgi:hypothetical protein
MSKSYCQKLSAIINHQASKPELLSTYVERVVEASEGTSQCPHDLTQEESQLFGILYGAVFGDSAKNKKTLAESHLTVIKIIATVLG